jgi:hypothetical protein
MATSCAPKRHSHSARAAQARLGLEHRPDRAGRRGGEKPKWIEQGDEDYLLGTK